MPKNVEDWTERKLKAKSMRIECRLLILNKDGFALREYERFYCEYVSPRVAVFAYQWIRRFFVRQKRKGRTELVDRTPELTDWG